MKKENSFVMPSSYACFIGGLVSGLAVYALLYFLGLEYFKWPVQRLLGPISSKGASFAIFIYIMLYVLFFWGMITLFLKSNLRKYEYTALDSLATSLQSTTIISKRTEMDNLRALITHGKEGSRIRETALVKTMLFLIDHCLVTETSERVMEIFSRRMDTLERQVDASYNILKYISWAIPSLGFIGTVLGIGSALGNAGIAIDNIELVTKPLGMAFDTTLIALVESIILMFFIHNSQHKEETLINDIDLFCQEKYIINLRMDSSPTRSK